MSAHLSHLLLVFIWQTTFLIQKARLVPSLTNDLHVDVTGGPVDPDRQRSDWESLPGGAARRQRDGMVTLLSSFCLSNLHANTYSWIRLWRHFPVSYSLETTCSQIKALNLNLSGKLLKSKNVLYPLFL